MLSLNHFISIVTIICNSFFIVFFYNKISNFNDKRFLKNLIVIITSSAASYLLNMFFSPSFLWIIFALLFTVLFYICDREKIFYILIKVLIVYITMIIIDFLVSLVIMFLPFNPSVLEENVSFVRALATLLVSIIMLVITKINLIMDFYRKILSFAKDKIKVLTIIIATIFLFSIATLGYFNFVNKSKNIFVFCSLLLVFFILIMIAFAYQNIKNRQQEDDEKKLISVINDYELMLENDRINRHEMLNNLIVLKSYKDKSSKGYEKILDEIIKNYQNKKGSNLSNIYKLPSGIKGIVYYKMYNINKNDIKFTSFITDECLKNIEALSSKKYYIVCKILGILLDNSIEAASESKNKRILLDIYLEDDTIIYIENSIKGKVDLSRIYKKGFSSKGTNRGIGLYLVSKMIKDNDWLSLSQEIKDNKFISILKIKDL